MNLCLRLGMGWIGRRVFTPPSGTTSVEFQSLTANGTSVTVSTTQLTATFDIDPGLTTANFAVTGASKGTVTNVDNVYTVNIHTITVEDGQSVTLDLIDIPSGVSVTPTSRTVVVYNADEAVDPYEPAWINTRFPSYNLDDDGWSVIEPEADSQLAYVGEGGSDATGVIYTQASPEIGADIRNPTGAISYFASINGALAAGAFRSAKSDWILVQRGYETVEVEALYLPYGNSNRHHITAFGDLSNGWPVVNCHMYGNGQDFFIRDSNRLALTHLHITNTEQNPSDTDFIGWEEFLTKKNKFFFKFKGSQPFTGFLMEGCKVDYFERGIEINGDSDTGNANDLIIRRNIISNIFGGFSIGINTAYSEILREENVFYKCGYYDIYPNVKQQDPYNGSIQTALASTLNSEVTEVALTTTIPTNTPIGTMLLIVDDASAVIAVPIDSFTGSTATIRATDFSSVSASAGNTVYIRVYGANMYHHSAYSQQNNYCVYRNDTSIAPASIHDKFISDPENQINSSNISAYGMLAVGGEVLFSCGGNVSSTTSARFESFDIAELTAIHLGHMSDRGIAYGIEVIDHKNSLVRNNTLVKSESSSAINKNAGLFKGVMDDVALENHLSYDAGNFDVSGVITAYRDYDLRGVLTESTPGVEFVDDSVSIDLFMSTATITEGIIAFKEALLERRLGNWTNIDKDFKSYIRSRITPTMTTPIITRNPSTAYALQGQNAQFTSGVYSSTPVSYQWIKGNNPVIGETGSKLLVENVSIENTGEQYSFEVTNENGTNESGPGTLNVIGDRFVPQISGTDYISLNAAKSIATGEGVRFKFRRISNSGASSINITLELTSGGSRSIGFIPSTNTISIRNSVDFNIPNLGATLYDGNVHLIEYVREGIGERGILLIDGIAYTNSTIRSSGGALAIGRFSGQGSGGTTSHQIFDIEFLDINGDVTLGWAFDSGEPTEAANVGSGTATFSLSSGGWISI